MKGYSPIPDDLLKIIHSYLKIEDTPFYQEFIDETSKLYYPKNEKELNSYRNELTQIEKKIIDKLQLVGELRRHVERLQTQRSELGENNDPYGFEFFQPKALRNVKSELRAVNKLIDYLSGNKALMFSEAERRSFREGTVCRTIQKFNMDIDELPKTGATFTEGACIFGGLFIGLVGAALFIASIIPAYAVLLTVAGGILLATGLTKMSYRYSNSEHDCTEGACYFGGLFFVLIGAALFNASIIPASVLFAVAGGILLATGLTKMSYRYSNGQPGSLESEHYPAGAPVH